MDGPDESDESSGAAGPGRAVPPEAPDRPWRHPSEIGLGAREEVDRRRGHGMVFAFVAVAGVVLIGTAVIAKLGSGGENAAEQDPDSQHPGVAATVQIDGPAGSRRAIAALVEDGTHAMASGSELGDYDGAELWVESGGRRSAASVAAVDPTTDMVLFALADPVPGTDAEPAEVATGEEFRFTYLDHMGHLAADRVAVADLDGQALRSNGSVAEGVMRLDGWTDHQGPLTDSGGRFAGWVFPAKGAQMVAYDAPTVASLAHRMAASG